jgi:phage terminase Nu1 subunit (DNA packaging protein)
MSFPREIATADLSLLLGITPRAVAKLVDRKILRKLARGTFDAADAVPAYIAFRESVVAEQYGLGEYGKARAQLYLERARMARIQRELLEGSVAPLAETRATWTTLAAAMVARLLAIPSKSAPRLVMSKSAGQAEAVVRAHISEALEDIHCCEIQCTDPKTGKVHTYRADDGGDDAPDARV